MPLWFASLSTPYSLLTALMDQWMMQQPCLSITHCNTWTAAENTSGCFPFTIALQSITSGRASWSWSWLIWGSRPPPATGRVLAKPSVSTGSTQGCCLKLFTLYTSDCVSTRDNTAIVKYADDTTILGLIKGGDQSGYRVLVNDILVNGE